MVLNHFPSGLLITILIRYYYYYASFMGYTCSTVFPAGPLTGR